MSKSGQTTNIESNTASVSGGFAYFTSTAGSSSYLSITDTTIKILDATTGSGGLAYMDCPVGN